MFLRGLGEEGWKRQGRDNLNRLHPDQAGGTGTAHRAPSLYPRARGEDQDRRRSPLAPEGEVLDGSPHRWSSRPPAGPLCGEPVAVEPSLRPVRAPDNQKPPHEPAILPVAEQERKVKLLSQSGQAPPRSGGVRRVISGSRPAAAPNPKLLDGCARRSAPLLLGTLGASRLGGRLRVAPLAG